MASSATPTPTATQAPIKPWQDASRKRQEEINVEVVVNSPPKAKAPSQPESQVLTITCGEGGETIFSVPEPVAKCSGLIRSIMDSSGNFIEQQTRKVHLADIQPHILKDVLSFLTQDYEENFTIKGAPGDNAASVQNTARIPFLFQMKPDSVMDMLAAALYLQIPSLAQYAVSMLAEYATDIPSFEGLTPDIVQDVCNRCKPDILRALEQRNMLAEFPTVNTMEVWRSFCENKRWGDLITTKQKERALRDVAYSDFSNNNNSNMVGSNNIIIDWRRGFAEISMEHMLTRVGTSYLQPEELMALASTFGDVIENLRLDATAFAISNVQMDKFLDHFPKLRFLEFLGNLQPFISQIIEILRQRPTLKGIRMNNCNINDEFLQEVTPYLANCNHLWELDLSQNFISHAGVKVLAEHVLSKVGLKYLSLAGNSIQLEGFRILGNAFTGKYKGIYALDVSDCRITLPKHDIFQNTFWSAEVTVLDLSGNHFFRHMRFFWQYLLSCNLTLTELNLSRAGLADGGMIKLLPFALAIPSLNSLNLSENSIHDNPMQFVAQMLMDPGCHLKRLDLSGNALGDIGARHLAQGLQVNTSLVELSLSRLNFTAEGVRAIDVAISRNPATGLKRVFMMLLHSNVLQHITNHHIIVTSPLPTYANFQFRWGTN